MLFQIVLKLGQNIPGVTLWWCTDALDWTQLKLQDQRGMALALHLIPLTCGYG